MKKHFISITLSFAALATMNAASVTEQQAQVMAQQFMQRSSTLKAAPAAMRLAHAPKADDGKALFYVFNRGTNDGFVIIAGDNNATPILAYSDRGTFDAGTMPENVAWWLQQYEQEMEYLSNHPEAARSARKLNAAVEPLLTTTWKQSKPYNEEIPTARFSRGTQRPIVGCVALAMAQVMKKHNWPTTGTGSYSYQWTATNEYNESATSPTTYQANFGATTYQWSSMKDSYSESASNATAVATLCYHCGVAVKMQYGVGASGAQIFDVVNALRTYFRYDKGLDLYLKDFYDSEQWDDMLRADLDAGQPIIYGGSTEATQYVAPTGHCFVFDGYDADGKFHINWGWGGQYNGYFATSLLDSGRSNANFSNWQQAVLGIKPDYDGTSTGTTRELTGYLIGFSTTATQAARGADVPLIMDGATFLGDGTMEHSWWGYEILTADEKQVVDAMYIVNADGIEIGATYSADEEATITVPANIADGTYHIRAMYSLDEGNTMKRFERPAAKPSYFKMVVSSGVAYFSDGDMDDPQPAIEAGDLNGDNTIDIDDVNMLIGIILGKVNEDDCKTTPNLNGESGIDVDDVNMLISIILAK